MSRSCGSPPAHAFASLKAIVDHYLAHRARDHTDEVKHFGHRKQSLGEAIDQAARSIWSDGTIHPHQRRVGHGTMGLCADTLSDHVETVRGITDFAALHRLLKTFLSPIDRIGELAIYDVAERIGWYLGVEPQEVYLHCGTRDGARILVPELRGETTTMDRFPEELHRLSPAQAESMLCIYKKELQGLRDRGLL